MAKTRGPLLVILAAGAAVLATSGKRRAKTVRMGALGPIWPLAYDPDPKVATTGGKSLGAPRDQGGRYHAGVDIITPYKTPVVATESGRIVATQPWSGAQAKALLLETNSGVVVNYGAVAPDSWEEFGVDVGSQVKAGQPIARIGKYPAGSSMLHFELYLGGTRKNTPWKTGRNPPPNLLDPTDYLLRAAKRVIS